MSGLAGVLAGHTSPGVYRWHAAFDVADVRHTVEHAGWRFAYVDGWRAQTKDEFLTAIGETLSFPAHYGHNFDALTDCLREVVPKHVPEHVPKQVPGDEPGVVLLWDGWGPLAVDEPQAFALAHRVLADRAANAGAGSFVVLLRGEGPDPEGISSLD